MLESILWFIIQYTSFWVGYLSLFSLAASFPKKLIPRRSHSGNRTYAILIPAYKEDSVILDTIENNLRVEFPRERYRIFVIADSLEKETLHDLSEQSIGIIPVSFENSTKAKAINHALHDLNTELYSHVIVLDADNVMAPDYLKTIDTYSDDVLQAAQTHRIAKNTNTAMSLLDALNEEIGNHIFRKGHVRLGLSSALIGSGMVFESNLFKSLMAPIRDTAGEDKMLEFALLENGTKVSYIEDALVQDEKVSNASQFEGQRNRWVAARFYFLVEYAGKSFRRLLQGDWDYFNKWLQFLQPQKTLLIALVSALYTVGLVLPSFNSYTSGLLALLILSFLIAIPKRLLLSPRMIASVLLLPGLVFRMIRILIRARTVDPSRFNVTEKHV